MTNSQATTQPKNEVKPRKKHASTSTKGKDVVDLKSDLSGSPREELIRKTAYSLYEARHCVNGFELDDWLQAEATVNQLQG